MWTRKKKQAPKTYWDRLGKRISDQAFTDADVNKSGFLEPEEVELAVYDAYHILNKHVPWSYDPPTRVQLQAALRRFDADGNGKLDRDEFYFFAKEMVKTGPGAIFVRLGKSAIVSSLILPISTFFLKKALPGGWLFSSLYLAILSPLLGLLFRFIWFLLRL